jgi:hypothetical protein
MTPADRERVRLELDRAGTPDDALARRLGGLDHPFAALADHGCDRCAEPWWSCICDPRRPYRQPTAAEVERARERRLARAERGD